jgi:apolipoprotein D and lipocalin family protein
MLICLLALCACAPRPAPAPEVFRDSGAPIYSSAVIEVARLEGHWLQVAGFAGEEMPCAPGSVDIQGGQISWSLCLDVLRQGAGAMVPGKAGRFAVEGTEEWWLLWVDGDYRTMVVGTPSGRFGFVLNREGALPGDRAQAVRDILTFNRYDIGNLRFY